MNKRQNITKICNMTCALLMAALIILQFVPFWYSVGGQHMTEQEYAAWSETYIPVAERPTESKAPTTAATTEATTEATTVAPTETTAAPTEETTDGTGATEETVPEETKKKGKDPFTTAKKDKEQNKNNKDKAVKPPMPTEIPTDPEIKTMSIAQSLWRTNRYKTDMAAPLLMFHVAVLGLGAVGIFFCIAKSKANLNCIWVLLVAILATLGYFTNPAAQTGMGWLIHGAVSAALLIPGIIMLVFSIKDTINWFTKVEN